MSHSVHAHIPLPTPHTGYPKIEPINDDFRPYQDISVGSGYSITVRQQPLHARVAMGKEKDRKPIDPPPILQLTVVRDQDPQQNFLQSPYFFMKCDLINAEESSNKEIPHNSLFGTLVSSLHKLKDTNNNDGGFFVFGDLSVKMEGEYKLYFTLFEMKGMDCEVIATAKSNAFRVYSAKAFPGMAESTFLTRSFSDQGVRLRLRKDSRTMSTRKRNSQAAKLSDDYRSTTRVRTTYDMGSQIVNRQHTHELSQSPQQDSPTARSANFQTSFGGYDRALPDTRESVQPSPSTHNQYFFPGPYTISGLPPTHAPPLPHHIPQGSVAPNMSPYMATVGTQHYGQAPPMPDRYGRHVGE